MTLRPNGIHWWKLDTSHRWQFSRFLKHLQKTNNTTTKLKYTKDVIIRTVYFHTLLVSGARVAFVAHKFIEKCTTTKNMCAKWCQLLEYILHYMHKYFLNISSFNGKLQNQPEPYFRDLKVVDLFIYNLLVFDV